MRDFDTRKPHEPNEPSRARSALIALKHRILLIADRIRTLLPANRVAPLLISGGILLLVVVVVRLGLLIYSPIWPSWLWHATHHDSQEVPPYSAEVLDSRDCPQYIRFEGTTCYIAYTNTRNRWALTLITKDIANKPQSYVSSIIEVTFFSESDDSSFTAGYCFEDDDVAEKALSDEELRRATVIDGDYVFIGGLDLESEDYAAPSAPSSPPQDPGGL